MKKLLPLLAILASATVSADWVKVSGATDAAGEKFIDMKAIRQTGPMNTMRRVWEITNLERPAPNKVLSTKNHVEYDCKDRRVRVVDESNFAEHWAQGENLTLAGQDIKPVAWADIRKGSLSETIFNRVCPNDD